MKKVKFKNLTPHAIRLYGNDGFFINIAPENRNAPARAYPSRKLVEHLGIRFGDENGVIHVTEITETAVRLPEPEEGVIFIASTSVARAAKRMDVLAPGDAICDRNGTITGCMGLTSYYDGDEPTNDQIVHTHDAKGNSLSRQESVESYQMQEALAFKEGNITHAAEAMKMSRSSFRRRMIKYGLLHPAN